MADLGDVSRDIPRDKPHAALSFPLPDPFPDVSRALPPVQTGSGPAPAAETPAIIAFG